MKKIIAIAMISLTFFSASAVAQEQTSGRCSVDCKVLQAVIDYLSRQPYKDVFQLVGAIQKNAKPMSPEPLKEDDKSQNKAKSQE